MNDSPQTHAQVRERGRPYDEEPMNAQGGVRSPGAPETAAPSSARHPDHPVDRLFVERWSPRALSGEAISEAELRVLFEAARWAPSSNNNQPWRFFYARRDTPDWPLFLDFLAEKNRRWAHRAAALLVIASDPLSPYNGQFIRTHAFCTGAAWMSLALQASLRGWVAHGMAGFDAAAAKTRLRLPETWEVHAMAAIGRPGRLEELPSEFHAAEKPKSRNAQDQFVFAGAWKAGS